MRAEYVKLDRRMRRASQMLIEEIGAAKPEHIDETATRAVNVIQDLRAEASCASARLQEYIDDHKAIMREPCRDDEVHCTCVPSLRKRCAELEAENTKLMMNVQRQHKLLTEPF